MNDTINEILVEVKPNASYFVKSLIDRLSWSPSLDRPLVLEPPIEYDFESVLTERKIGCTEKNFEFDKMVMLNCIGTE